MPNKIKKTLRAVKYIWLYDLGRERLEHNLRYLVLNNEMTGSEADEILKNYEREGKEEVKKLIERGK